MTSVGQSGHKDDNEVSFKQICGLEFGTKEGKSTCKVFHIFSLKVREFKPLELGLDILGAALVIRATTQRASGSNLAREPRAGCWVSSSFATNFLLRSHS